jgi:hypothetical protein
VSHESHLSVAEKYFFESLYISHQNLWKGQRICGMKESSMVTAIKRQVARIPGTRIKKLWSNQMNRDIDLLVVTNGLACFYEIKVPGEVPSDWQNARLDWWKEAAADVGWFDTVDACIARIRYMAEAGAKLKVLANEYGRY